MDITPELRDFITNQNWIFAKTYADTYPHEYIVREKVDAILYLKLANHINTFGYQEYFYSKQQTYFEFNGFTYWQIDNIINRCVIADTYHERKKNKRLPRNKKL